MNILMIADVVARPGRIAVLEKIQGIARAEYKIDIATMNAENVAGGFSITPAIADELFESGIDLMTSGNHIFDKQEIIPYIKKNSAPAASGKLSARNAGKRVICRRNQRLSKSRLSICWAEFLCRRLTIRFALPNRK